MNKLVSRNPVLRFKEGKKILYYLGGSSRGGIKDVLHLEYKTPKLVNTINNREKQLAKHHFSSIRNSEGIWDTIKHVGRGIQHAYNGWIDPATTYQTGIAPTPSFTKGAITNITSKLGLVGKKISNVSDVSVVGVPRNLVPEGERITIFKQPDGTKILKYFDKKFNKWIEVFDDTPDVKVVGVLKASKPTFRTNNSSNDVLIVNESNSYIPEYDYNNDVQIINSSFDDAYNYDPGLFDFFKKGGQLSSKNPILRFKLGRKIVKALYGYTFRKDGVRVNKMGIPAGNYYDLLPTLTQNKLYQKTFPKEKQILPGMYLDYAKDIWATRPDPNNKIRHYEVLIAENPRNNIENGTYYETKDASGKIIDRGRYFGGKKHSLPIGPESKKSSLNNSNQKTINTPNQKTANKGLSTYKINKLNRKISNPGAYHNITTWQNKLKDFYAPGTFKVDGIWGKNTEAAYLKYLLDQSNKKVLDSLSSITPLTNLSNPIIENPSNINILVPKQTYNRTQIREFLRNKGVNPYQFNGAQRKALRMILNGQGTDDDKALVQGMGIFKQGGNLLPSRNIVERFKLRKFK